ncbi:hypothetical protein KNJ79_05215 [Sphingopyxis indica]|uniref:hypothetical protein n=1 Tax=Sphingopyxis indica TaxID=436663 RepID=UPI0029391D11|nr:hypothetical protein [Sphingopyxis indica]WOF44332.1 hypothetical protein KNJ79_05215 [Sphingopyxis indica]
MTEKKSKGPTKAELTRKLKEMEAQLASSYHFASATLEKAGNLAASAVVVELTALGGRQLINPVAIRGGLSPETITALRKDIARSWDETTELKPIR